MKFLVFARVSMKIKLILFINIVLATYNPLKLYTHSLGSIESNLTITSVNIINRIYPDFFNNHHSPEYTGLYDIFYFEIPSNKKIDLSEMDIERIPVPIASKMKKVKSLNLSCNEILEIEDEWFKYFYDDLEELNINNCNIPNENLKIIQNCKSLKKLSLSGSIDIDIKCLFPIIPKLTYLDVSNCSLNGIDLHTILENGINLEYLNFNQNNLLILPCFIKSNLKILKVSNCMLNSLQCLSILMNLEDLEEIDLSRNNFRDMNSNIIDNIFNNLHDEPASKRICFHDNSILSRNYKSNLKRINLSCCKIKSQEFVKNLFNIKGLEILKLDTNNLNFDFKEIVEGRSKETLKELHLKHCTISSSENVKYLTDFISLEKIDLSNNLFKNMTENFSLGISKNSLSQIDMRNCNLNHFGLKAITACSKLEKLDVSENDFGEFPLNFSLGISKSTLKDVNASSCNLNHVGLKIFSECLKLERLEIQNNSFQNIPLNFSLDKLKYSLKELNISECELNINGWNAILDCERIKSLNLSVNSFQNHPDKFNIKFKDCLNKLEIRRCCLTTRHFRIFTDCPNLKTLDGFGNDFSSIENSFTLGCSKNSLKDVILGGCQLDEHCLKELTDCPCLKSLHLYFNNFNNISDDFRFGRSRDSLNFLDLTSTFLNHNGLKAITSCRKLNTLFVSGNDFRSVPFTFNFKNLEGTLTFLEIDNCDLNYNCLLAISKCKKLIHLDISENQILKADSKVEPILKYFSKNIFSFLY